MPSSSTTKSPSSSSPPSKKERKSSSSSKKRSKRSKKQQPPGVEVVEDDAAAYYDDNNTTKPSSAVKFVDEDDGGGEDSNRPSSSGRNLSSEQQPSSSKRNLSEQRRRPSNGLNSTPKSPRSQIKRSNSGKRSTNKSYVDPSGYSTKSRDTDLMYENDELNPLNGSKDNQTLATGPIDDDDDDDDADEELLDDTFTFLMTAKYPLEDCLCASKRNKEINENDPMTNGGAGAGALEPEEEMGAEEEEEMEPLDHMAASTGLTKKSNNVALEDIKNPDAYYLPFWLGFFVITSQLFIYAIVLANVLRDPVPPNADLVLRLAQIFAVFVTLYTQSDFIDGIFLFTESWKAFREITGPVKFKLSALCRILAGNVGILSTFLLVMYSEEVVDLLLNFTAMEFVATLDDSAFELAAKGFLGGALELKGEIVREFRYKPRHSKKRRRLRFWVYIFYIALVFGAFFVIVGLQRNRAVGVDNEVYIQFDNTDAPELYGISGVYHGCNGFQTEHTRDIGYIDISLKCPNEMEDREKVKTKDKKTPARTFVYCHEIDGWVLSLKETANPCVKGEYLIRSFVEDPIPANAFDILSHSDATWVVARSEIGNEAILDNKVVESIQEIPSNFVNCGGGGLIRTDKDERLQSTFQPLAQKLYPSFEFEKIKEDKGCSDKKCPYNQAFGQMYRPLFFRPIHDRVKTAAQKDDQSTEDEKFQVIFYDSLRWNRIYLNPRLFASHIQRDGECGKNNNEDPDCFRVFIKYFHTANPSWRSNYTIAIFDGISDPMMLLSTTDTGVPTSKLKWYESRLADGKVLTAEPYGGFDPKEMIEGYIAPVQQELCLQLEFDEDVWNDQWYVDGVLNPNSPPFIQLVDAVCNSGSDGVEEACNIISDGDVFSIGDDYDYEYDDYFYNLLGCGEEIDTYGFKCDVVPSVTCNEETEQELHIKFDTDFAPFESSIIAYYGNGNETTRIVKNLELANRTFAVGRTTSFSIPSNGLADLRFEDANSPHLLSACVPISTPCVQVVMLDSLGDGISCTTNGGVAVYEIAYGKDPPIEGGGSEDFSCKVYNLGPRCTEKGDDDGSAFGQAQSFVCNYEDVMNSFPDNVEGQVDEPSKPKDKYDFLGVAETFQVTADAFVTDPPVTLPPLPCDDTTIQMAFEVMTDDYAIETSIGIFIGQAFDEIPNLEVFDIDLDPEADDYSYAYSYYADLDPEAFSQSFLTGLSEGYLGLVNFNKPSEMHIFGTCFLADTQCVQVVIADSAYDGLFFPAGYNITYGTDPPVRSIDAAQDTDDEIFWGCRQYQFGSGCINTLNPVPTLCVNELFQEYINPNV